jgi:hypothetical protein
VLLLLAEVVVEIIVVAQVATAEQAVALVGKTISLSHQEQDIL